MKPFYVNSNLKYGYVWQQFVNQLKSTRYGFRTTTIHCYYCVYFYSAFQLADLIPVTKSVRVFSPRVLLLILLFFFFLRFFFQIDRL